jgi:hypothetical protein
VISVRHVVDREVVADRRRHAGTALRLVVAADDRKGGNPAARLAERDVPDVEGARADEQAHHSRVRVRVAPPQLVAWLAV